MIFSNLGIRLVISRLLLLLLLLLSHVLVEIVFIVIERFALGLFSARNLIKATIRIQAAAHGLLLI